MGNFFPCCWSLPSSSSSSPSSQGRQDTVGDKTKTTAITSRKGASGLADLGLEYRLIRCEAHTHGNDGANSGRLQTTPTTTPPTTTPTTTCFECATRLFHIESGVMIDATNRKQFIPYGPFYNRVSALCQEVAQERLIRELGLKLITLCDGDGDGDGNTTNTSGSGSGSSEPPIKALVDQDFVNDNDNEKNRENESKTTNTKPLFLFITGKGRSRAGIISNTELVLTAGMERGSALFHLQQARRQGMATLCLDPNARGPARLFETVHLSLTALFRNHASLLMNPIYVLAYSAGGAGLVRYLLVAPERRAVLRNLAAIAFCDSAHRLSWAAATATEPRSEEEKEKKKNHPHSDRDDDDVWTLLQSSRCLYIRNDQERPVPPSSCSHLYSSNGSQPPPSPPQPPGEPMERGGIFWHQRFGDITTVWAGTREHTAVCWVPRHVIWNFFNDRGADERGKTRIDASTTTNGSPPADNFDIFLSVGGKAGRIPAE